MINRFFLKIDKLLNQVVPSSESVHTCQNAVHMNRAAAVYKYTHCGQPVSSDASSLSEADTLSLWYDTIHMSYKSLEVNDKKTNNKCNCYYSV